MPGLEYVVLLLVNFDSSNERPNAPHRLMALIGFTKPRYGKDLRQE